MNSSKPFTQIEVTEIGFNNFPRIIVNFLHVFPCILTQNLVYYRNLAIFIRHAKRLNYNNNLVIAAKLQNDINKNTAFEKLTFQTDILPSDKNNILYEIPILRFFWDLLLYLLDIRVHLK